MSSSKAPLSKQKSKKTQQNPEKQPDPEKRKTVRYSGGEVWEDASLADWPENDFRMWVGDLGPEVTDEMLTREFSVYPSFNKAKVVKDNKTKKSKGYGFLSFGTSEDFLRAFQDKNGKYVGSRPLRMKRSTWKEKSYDVSKRREERIHK